MTNPIAVPRIVLPAELYDHRRALPMGSPGRVILDDVFAAVTALHTYLKANDQLDG
jgi:hypothetical protein